MLISRTQSRLDDASKEIGTKYNVKTKTIAVDFGKADAGTWSTLKAEVRHRLPEGVVELLLLCATCRHMCPPSGKLRSIQSTCITGQLA